MSVVSDLQARAENKCELCGSETNLTALSIGPESTASVDQSILACQTCSDQITNASDLDATHWHCLNESAWSQVPAVQVSAWRLLSRLSNETWARDLLDMLYLDDETLAWAKSGLNETTDADNDAVIHKDTFGAVLSAGDTVTLIKDLKVKGANFTAKRGTAVRNIALVPDNAGQIEGRVNDQRIVILTEFVKKA